MTPRSGSPRKVHTGSSVLSYVLLFLLLAGRSATYSQDMRQRVYMLNDYDYNTTEWNNDFFGSHGVWEYNGSQFTATYPQVAGYYHELRLDYDVTPAQSSGGWWELFTYSYTDPTTPVYDLSPFTEFRFSVRAAPHSTSRFSIEFVQGNFEKTVRYEITGVDSTMKEYVVPLSTVLAGFDRTRMKSVATVFENGDVTSTTGTLYFDNLYFVAEEPKPATDDAMLEDISHRAFRYFVENVHPATGLVRDHAASTNVSSIAGVGFQLAALGIGADRAWITRADAADRTKKIFETLLYTPQDSNITGSIGYRGFFYHLLDPATGTRLGNSELSSIDASLCLAGVIFAREYFDDPSDPTETDIRRMGDSMYQRVDWNWMLKSAGNVFYMAWRPESGFDVYTWDYLTDETILVCLLAIGSGQVDPSVFYAWQRNLGSYHGFTCYQTWWGSLFTNFFAQCWIPGEQLGLDRAQPTPVNWWQNSATAALADRQFCIDSSARYKTYSDSSWGLTACFGPGGYNGGLDKSYGAAPLGDWPPNHDGTVAPYGAGCCLPLFPKDPSSNLALQALRNYYDNFPKLWGLYGLKDAYNLGTSPDSSDDWFTDDYVSIDSGPLLVMIENYRSNLVWKYFSRNAQIHQALKLVFQDTATFTSVRPVPFPSVASLEQNYPNPFNPTTVIRGQWTRDSEVRLVVYDLLGREVAVLADGRYPAGRYAFTFDGTKCASGVYLYRLKAGSFIQTKRMILLR